MMKKKIEKALDILRFRCLHRGNKVAFLRSKGATIGVDCQIITKASNFGTEPYLVNVGDRVTLASGVVMITHDGSTRVYRSEFPEMNRYGNVFAPVSIGHDSFVGLNAIILPGSSIGTQCIVGAGAIVKGVFPDRLVIAGNPARVIRSLDDHIDAVRKRMLVLHAENRFELRQELESLFSI